RAVISGRRMTPAPESCGNGPMNPELPEEIRLRLHDKPCDMSLLAQFAPSHTRAERLGPAPADSRSASVIVLLYPREDAWHVPLVLRPTHLKHHQGQVALPGGACEPGETLDRTALRELEEELGADSSEVQILGSLVPFFVPVSRFLVHSWV